jgi:hypothetical protein
MSDNSEEARLRAEAKFKKKEQAEQDAEKVWTERATAEKTDDDKRARLKAMRLAKDAAEKPSKSRVNQREKPPTGTKGEEITSQGQVDEATRRRTGPRSRK